MLILKKLWRGLRRLFSGLLIFVGLAWAWGMLLYSINPWSTASPGEWPGSRPIAISSPATQTTRVILYRHLEEATLADPALVPWPATASGSNQLDRLHTTWETASGKPWQFEVRWDDRDHVLDSRYRLEGKKPVLVESRGRDVGVAFQGIILALVSILVWHIGKWVRKKMVKSPIAE